MDATLLCQQWLDDPKIDKKSKDELRAIANNSTEIEDRFYRSLEFGTAGLRGILGVGTNRINQYVVARTSEGYARYVCSQEGAAKQGVVIAYDSRNESVEFAQVAAQVLTAQGIEVRLFDTLHSVPQLSFAIGYYQCFGGIVITASHNPAIYNGYKVYGSNGAQISPVIAEKITEQIEAIDSYTSTKRMPLVEAQQLGLLTYIGNEVDNAYYDYVQSLVIQPSILNIAKQFKVVYTPLNGTGNIPVRHILQTLGIENVYVVQEQESPDGDFPTLEAPNPELISSYVLAKELAMQHQADLILATDPDADRLGVVVCAKDGSMTILNGNQIGYLMGEYILSQRAALGTLPDNALIVRSIVTGNMLDAIAKQYDVAIHEVLTGFRYIGEQVDQYTRSGEFSFVFGFEESNGYLSGTKVRDKDAIGALVLITEIAAYYAQKDMTLLDALHALYKTYGYYGNAVANFALQGKKGMDNIQAAMQSLRDDPPTSLGHYQIEVIRDYQIGTIYRCQTGDVEKISLPKSDALYYELAQQTWLCVRPSGTEPKLKFYANTHAENQTEADEKLTYLIKKMQVRLQPWLSI